MLAGAPPKIVVEDFRPIIGTSSLCGFVTVKMPRAGLVFFDVGLHVSGTSAWASPSAKPLVDRNGTVLVGADGRRRYTPIVGFTSKQVRDKFSIAVIGAVRIAFPDAQIGGTP
jgi:hypothetical protein